MNVSDSDIERTWRGRARALAGRLTVDAPAERVIRAAADEGVLGTAGTLPALAVVVHALAVERAAAAVALALHASVVARPSLLDRLPEDVRSRSVAALALSADEIPEADGDRVSGVAAWVGPLTPRGLAVVGMRGPGGLVAGAVALDAPGVVQQPVATAALEGIAYGHLRLNRAQCWPVGPTEPLMVRARILLASAGLGMGHRALREALAAARGRTGRGAAGEQTVQGLLADAATDLDAAGMLTRQAATAAAPSLGDASMAKLAATDAAHGAVVRATQVVGADSFRRGHIIERLAQDVRALELFAGRTEALREAVARERLPR